MREDIPEKIDTAQEAVAFVIGLIESRRIFHFDDDPATVVCGDKRVFSEAEASILRQRVAETRRHFPDPCSLIIRLQRFRDKERSNDH